MQSSDTVRSTRTLRELVLQLAVTGLAALASPMMATAAEEPRSETSDDLEISARKPQYEVGDRLELNIRSSRDCWLTIVNVDQRGRGTVLFPSELEPDNRLVAQRDHTIPGIGALYTIRFDKPGRETFIAICSPSAEPVDGIRHDFERQRFTDLGNYEEFRATATETRRRPAQKPGSRLARRERRTTPVSPDRIMRATLEIDVAPKGAAHRPMVQKE